MISGYVPEDNICWQFNNPGDRNRDRRHRRTCPACSGSYSERTLAYFGRCRSGQRWFWVASRYFGEGEKATGFTDTEDAAVEAAMTAVRSFRDGQPILARVSHGCASRELKALNKAKRAARPASDATDSRIIEYLYSGKRGDHGYGELYIHRFRITKRTAKRIFYARASERVDERGEPSGKNNFRLRTDDETGFIDRVKLETEGRIYSSHKWDTDWHLFPSLEAVIAYLRQHDEPEVTLTDLAALKQAMADAHPDKGGSSADFIAARAVYVAARRQSRAAR